MRSFGIALGMVAFMPCVAAAQQDDLMRFDVRYGPLRPAQVVVQSRQDAQSYSVRGDVESSGIVGLLRDFHFHMVAEGQHDGTAFRPAHFTGDIDSGRHETRVEIGYSDGVPRVLALDPPEPASDWALDPSTQAGSLDPMTALFRLIRTAPEAELCDADLRSFDGRHSRRLVVGPARATGARLICDGQYLRIGGYSPEDLADYTSLPFRLEFERADRDLWQLARATMETPYGRMRLIQHP